MAKQTFILNAEKRDKKVKPNALRRNGDIPGVVYGHGVPTVEIFTPYKQFVKIYNEAGESSLVDLNLKDEGNFKVLIQDTASNPLTEKFVHFDLYRVKMTEKLKTPVELKFVGISPCVAELGGVLVKSLDEIEVRCLPGDLVSEIEVDLSSLKNFGNVIKISDLKIPDGLEVLDSKDLIVATVMEPAKEEVITSAPVEEKVEEVEVIKKEKKVEEEEPEK